MAASGSDDADDQARGPAADRARAAALELYPGGTVTGIERDVEGRRTWEVEVRRADGTVVDLDLTGDLQRVRAETDEPEDAGDREQDRGEPADDADDRGERDDDADDRGERDDDDED